MPAYLRGPWSCNHLSLGQRFSFKIPSYPCSDIHDTAAINLWWVDTRELRPVPYRIIQERTRTLSLQQEPWRCISLIARGTDMKWHEVAAYGSVDSDTCEIWPSIRSSVICGMLLKTSADKEAFFRLCGADAQHSAAMVCTAANGPCLPRVQSGKLGGKLQLVSISMHQRIKSKMKYQMSCHVCHVCHVPDRLAGSHRSSPDSQVHRTRRTRRTCRTCRILNLCKGAMKAIPNPKDPGGSEGKQMSGSGREDIDGEGIGWLAEAFTHEASARSAAWSVGVFEIRPLVLTRNFWWFLVSLVMRCMAIVPLTWALWSVLRTKEQLPPLELCGAHPWVNCPFYSCPPSSQHNRIFPAPNAAMPCHAPTFDYQIHAVEQRQHDNRWSA